MNAGLTLLGIAGQFRSACGLHAQHRPKPSTSVSRVVPWHPVFRQHTEPPCVCAGFSSIRSGPRVSCSRSSPLNFHPPVLHVHPHFVPLSPLDRDGKRKPDRTNRASICPVLLEDAATMKFRTRHPNNARASPFDAGSRTFSADHFSPIRSSERAPNDVKAASSQGRHEHGESLHAAAITDGLGRAIAGRPFVVPIIETRVAENTKSADAPDFCRRPPRRLPPERRQRPRHPMFSIRKLTASAVSLFPLSPLAGEGAREGACLRGRAVKCAPSLTLPRKRERGLRSGAGRDCS